MRAMLRLREAIVSALLNQRGHLFPWAPVAFATGIGTYFALRFEPGTPLYAALALIAAPCAFAAFLRPSAGSPLLWALALAAAGFATAGHRAADVAAPVLGWRYYGPVEGRIVNLDRSASDAVRVTLDQVRLEDVAPARTPAHVRISLHGPPATLMPGQRVMTTGHLSPPQGPVEPGGFDFRRNAWFQRLGAVGYTRNPVLTTAPPGDNAGLRLFALRHAISQHVQQTLGGDTGGFAAAVTTGDRSGMGQGALEALRASNLAHLLAISGLHMGLLAGFVFATLRLCLAAIPPLALRLPVRKLAALGALAAATVYLGLSGGNVATERAFSLRAVALAALIVLALRPEALLGPGFQMSFAATTALVAVFTWLRDADLPALPAWARPAMGVLISSAVAGAATAPVGAAHFNALSHYGLIANLASVPVMGALVVPAAVLALCLAPLGLDWIGLWLMGLGLDWILAVAHWVAGLPGARSYVPGPGPIVLPLLTLGMLWLILWQGRARLAGLVPAAVALALWAGTERPSVLIADTGTLVGVMTPEGRALSKPKGAGFIADTWLENDGDGATQSDAAARWPEGEGKVRIMAGGGYEIVHLSGKRAAAGFTACAPGQLVVASVPFALTGGCEVFDPKRLRATGSLAIAQNGIRTAQDVTGQRLWNTPPRREPRYARNQ